MTFWVLKHSFFFSIISHTEISTSFCRALCCLQKPPILSKLVTLGQSIPMTDQLFFFLVLIFLYTLFWLLDLLVIWHWEQGSQLDQGLSDNPSQHSALNSCWTNEWTKEWMSEWMWVCEGDIGKHRLGEQILGTCCVRVPAMHTWINDKQNRSPSLNQGVSKITRPSCIIRFPRLLSFCFLSYTWWFSESHLSKDLPICLSPK